MREIPGPASNSQGVIPESASRIPDQESGHRILKRESIIQLLDEVYTGFTEVDRKTPLEREQLQVVQLVRTKYPMCVVGTPNKLDGVMVHNASSLGKIVLAQNGKEDMLGNLMFGYQPNLTVTFSGSILVDNGFVRSGMVTKRVPQAHNNTDTTWAILRGKIPVVDSQGHRLVGMQSPVEPDIVVALFECFGIYGNDSNNRVMGEFDPLENFSSAFIIAKPQAPDALVSAAEPPTP